MVSGKNKSRKKSQLFHRVIKCWLSPRIINTREESVAEGGTCSLTPENRKPVKRTLLQAWESCDTDHGLKDDMFHVCHQLKQKCRYLDEKNIVVSHRLLSDSCFDPEERQVTAELCPNLDIYRDYLLADESGTLQADLRSQSQTSPDTAQVPTNTNTITDVVIHKQNISHEFRPAKTCISELKRSLPLIRWAPATYRVQVTEEPVAWRCKGSVSVNRDATPDGSPHLWKKPFGGWRLEQCHGGQPRLVLQEKPSPGSGLAVARTRTVIRGAARGARKQGDHVDQSLYWSPLARSTGLLCGDNSGLLPLLHTPKPAKGSRAQYIMQEEAGRSRQLGQEDGGHMFHRKQEDISMGSSMLDMLCHSGCQGNSESPTIPHDVTLFHILQVLQSKPVSLPEVRVPRHLKVPQRLKA